MTMIFRFVFLLCLSAQIYALPSFQSIFEHAQLSDIAYSKGDHNVALNAIKHDMIRQTVLEGVEVNYILSIRDGVQYLTIRGTANVQNALVDLEVNLLQDIQLNIFLHQGFARSAIAIYDDVKSSLNPRLPIHTTGHSLGGAVAVILAMYLQKNGFDLQQVITFGQPKVTNLGGSNQFENLPLLRVVTPKDIVPLVPPLSPLQIKNLDIYWHMGEEMILYPELDFAMTSGVKSMLRATKFTQSLPNEENLNAHKMQTYLSLIVPKLNGAKEVPYASQLNFFGLN